MKSSETISATSNILQAKEQLFFQKQGEGQGAFFSAANHSPTPFFNFPAIQPKLTIGQQHNKNEPKVDAMANQVAQKLASDYKGTSVQRKCAECAQEDEGKSIIPKLQPISIFESNEDQPVQENLQRKCAACEAKRIQPMRIQRRSGEEEESELQAKSDGLGLQTSSDLESRLNATKGTGSPLPAETQSSMGNAFGADFSGVRVHTNSGAMQMNQELGAQAFTHGSDVYFNSGKYSPGSTEGQRLLGHELTHVVQQGGGGIQKKQTEKTIQRSVEDWVLWSTGESVSEAEIFMNMIRLEYQRPEIYSIIDESLATRELLSQQCDPLLTEQLYEQRNSLIPLLESRVSLIRTTITDLYNYLENKDTSDTDDEEYRTNMQSLASEGEEQLAYLNRLKRWKIRERIDQINEVLSQQSDPTLEWEKQEITELLLSTATEFKQFAQPWGSDRYGKTSNCTTIGQAGCGPTSLAIILEFMYQDDPEVQRPITPKLTANYAENYGRVCPVNNKGGGTAGDKMMDNIGTEWQEYNSIKLSGVVQAEQELHNGNLIMFLCKNCKGLTEGERASKYGGHYMVLNGVSDDGQTFDVLDPGRNDTKDIHTISRRQLETKTQGFWMVVRVAP